MKKHPVIFLLSGALLFFLIGMFLLNNNSQEDMGSVPVAPTPTSTTSKTPSPTKPSSPTNLPVSPTKSAAKDPQNATYIIEGTNVTLVNGSAQDNGQTVQMFGSPTVGDLTGDSVNDAGVILVVSGSGSGVFYYAAAALNNPSSKTYQGTNALFLGDRIAPQTNNISDETFIVNFAERAEGEPMSAQPSVGVSKYFMVQNTTLVETNK